MVLRSSTLQSRVGPDLRNVADCVPESTLAHIQVLVTLLHMSTGAAYVLISHYVHVKPIYCESCISV